MGVLTTVFAFLLVLGPLVVIHELGHYLVGRLFGVKAEAFSVGFGKELAGWTDRRGTRWKLSALPLGGYVQFAGDMNPASAPDSGAAASVSPQERAQMFQFQPLWQRALIVFAGPLTNLLLCVAIFAAFTFFQGNRVIEPVISDFAEHSAAKAAGLAIGDRIVSIDGQGVGDVQDVARYVMLHADGRVPVVVERAGKQVRLPVTIATREIDDGFGKKARIGDLGIAFDQPVVAGFAPDSPAKAAGFAVGDRIVRIDDVDVTSFQDVVGQVQPRAGQTLRFTVLREGARHVFLVPVQKAMRPDGEGKAKAVGMIGVEAQIGRLVPVGPFKAVAIGFDRSFELLSDMLTGLRQIVFGERSVKELGGPIKIAQASGQQFSLGWENFVGFAAFISINLAFINLLPIPGLDGGHLAFYAAEWVRRKPLDVRSQEWAIRTGVMFLLALMLFVTVNDIVALPIFGG
ncbi:RIP metalloprotease RseP [Novosphingobium profundi]|uniref:RIP metalloprotease RseP n=1 Tax=Novosphingobium profundi TaxID=1774954 RepID=UPI001BDA3697|nr:RIP metalloprotease RseP [Novosphingobium profundi]MBT0668063.1 RIP metalloprotease RseP [Novosphingobium profundi]